MLYRLGRRLVYGAAAVVLLLVLYFQLPWMAVYWASSAWSEAPPSEKALWLHDYRVTLDAHEVAGVTRNLSGITYSPHTGTLFGIVNKPSMVVELSLEGATLRTLPITPSIDAEAITHLAGEQFVISDERTNSLYRITLQPDTKAIGLSAQPAWAFDFPMLHENLGVEALHWNPQEQSLWVGTEKWPLRLVQLPLATASKSLNQARSVATEQLAQARWHSQGWGSMFLNDLAAIASSPVSGNLLLLSEESALVAEYTPEGDYVSSLPLWRGVHGLAHKIPQPEGMTLGPDGSLYIVSEPNLLYRYEKF